MEQASVKVIILSCITALALGYGASLLLSAEHRPAYEAYSTSGARVGEPGDNLVGPGWYGNDQKPAQPQS